jgi:hypothetical protein
MPLTATQPELTIPNVNPQDGIYGCIRMHFVCLVIMLMTLYNV